MTQYVFKVLNSPKTRGQRPRDAQMVTTDFDLLDTFSIRFMYVRVLEAVIINVFAKV